MRKCGYADHYKAMYPPRCDDGRGCDVCNKKWKERQDEKTIIQVREERRYFDLECILIL